MKTTKNLNIWLAMSMFLLLMVSTATAEIIFVDADASGANTGSSWAHAYYFLQDALAAASSGDQIWVAQGIYKPDHGGGNTPGSRTATFRLKNGVVLKGGYAGAGTPNPNARDIAAYETILSGDLADNDGPNFVNYGDNSYHVVTGSGINSTAVLDGFTITGGNADAYQSYSSLNNTILIPPPLFDPKRWGGGMYNDRGSPTINNCTFSSNSSRYGGAAVYNKASSSPTLSNCTFNGNHAKGNGGGISSTGSCNPTLTDCTFRRNSASSGGSMYNEGNPTLTNCLFIENSAGSRAGGIYSYHSNPTLTDCTFYANSAGYGGAMAHSSLCSTVLTGCTFSGNSASKDGGAIYSTNGNSLTLTRCTLTGNSAGELGGAMYNGSGGATLTNCRLSENSSAWGGGMYNDAYNNSTLANCTITNNRAGKDGGGICSHGATTTVTNCILWDDTATEGHEIALFTRKFCYSDGCSFRPSLVTVSYSDVQGGSEGIYIDPNSALNWWGGNIDADPCFVSPGYWDPNGVWFEEDYHLLFTSPCIDAGDPDYVPSPGEKDIDGEPRVIGGRVDMGVDEFTSTLTTILRVSPTEFQFSSYENGPNPKEQIMSIRNIGSATLNWEITEDCPWLDVYPASGESTGQMNEVILSADISGMAPDSYECLLTIDANDALNSPQMVTVTLNLGGSVYVPLEYDTIQAAIDAAIDWDTVIVAEGTYTGIGNRDIDFHGKKITVRSENGPENCIIDCNGTEDDPHRGFYFHSGEDANSVVEGLTITDGHGFVEPDYHNWSLGGGIYCTGSGPTITNCIITGNSATQGGGIFAWKNSSPTITNCTISENTGAKVHLSGPGGGIHCWRNSTARIENCIISANKGRGIYCSESSANILNCTIANNGMDGIDSHGDGPLTISNCRISDNRGSGIGALVRGTDTATISNCVITGNNASFDGGGIRVATLDDGVLNVTNCTITGNSAIDHFGHIGRGGGISCRSTGNTIITNSIVCNNIGGDIYVWNFVMPPNGDWTTEPTELTVSYSCPGVIFVQKDPIFGDPILIFGDGNIDADPCFVQPRYWEPPLPPPSPPPPPPPLPPPLAASSMSDTLQYIWAEGDYHLLPDSPCINAGDPNYIADPNETDLDGKPRVMGGRVDMGAYEYQGPQILYVDADAIGANDGSSWADAYNYLQDALAVAQYGDEIRVAQGIYTPDSNSAHPNGSGDREATFQLKNGVAIRGGYAGFGEPDPNARDIDGYETILTGDLNGDDANSFYPQEPLRDPTRRDNSYHVVTGSGTDNTAVLNGFIIAGGNANGFGPNDDDGGGMYNNHGSPTLVNCTFTGNTANDGGGGMLNSRSSPTLINCTFDRNQAGQLGGGMCNSWESASTVTNCIFTGNSSGKWGGALYNVLSNLTVVNCTVSGNIATSSGGGIYIAPLPPSAGESTITSYYITNTITNCIFWENLPEQIVNYISVLASVTYCDVQGGRSGVFEPHGAPSCWREGNTGADPCFVRPGYWDANDTPDDTNDDFWIEGDYHLLPYSVCIDAGDPNYVAEPNETDLDGKPRVMGGRIDMGAYETIPPIPAEVRITPRSINLASKGKWITCYIWLPDDYNVSDIDSNSILLNCKIQAESVQVNEQQQITIARFYRSEVQSTLNIGEAELSIIGWLIDGTVFEGRDLIRVTSKSGGKPDKYVQASNPNPADGATSVSIYTDLSWTASPSATSHDVYFGTSSLPPFVCNQIATAFDPGTMGYGTTYYWRIDEVNKFGKTTGQVWSFTTIEGPVPPPPP